MRPRDIVGRRMREIRDAQDLSLRALAERMQKIGGEPIHASALQRIEKAEGGRGVTVDELLALAAALGVPPIALLTTRADAGAELVRVTSKVAVTMGQFREWLFGGATVSVPRRHYPLPLPHYRASTLLLDNGLSDELRGFIEEQVSDEGAED